MVPYLNQFDHTLDDPPPLLLCSSSSSILHYSAETATGVQCINCSVRFADAVEHMRNEVINWKVAIQRLLNKVRDVLTRLEATKCRSFPRSTRHQLKWTSADLMSGSRHANDARGSPSTMSTLQRGTHHLYIASAIKCVVYPPLGHHARNVLLDWHAFQLNRVDSVGGTKLFGHLKLRGVDINGDDPTRSCFLCTLNYGQSLFENKLVEPTLMASLAWLHLRQLPLQKPQQWS